MEGIILKYSHWEARDVIVTEKINLKELVADVHVETYYKRPIYSKQVNIVNV